MEPLERKVAGFIQDHALFAGTGRVLLAVSGGVDSIALLHVMRRLISQGVVSAEPLCAHLNHRLRGAASDGDEAFVVQQARELNLPTIVKTVDVKTHAQEHHLSIETAARQLRLGCLAEIARAHTCTSIALGHQKNDNAETIVQRLERGTGLRGLGGIWPSRQAGGDLMFVRPLLCCSRQEIVDYLQARSLSWREDHTNADCMHTRNRIRHRLLPALQAASDSSLVEELAALAASARRLYARISEEAEDAARKHTRARVDEAIVDATALAGLPEPVGIELLRQLLTRLGLGERDLTRRHYRGVLALAERCDAGRTVSLPDGFSAHRESDTIVLRPPSSQSRSHELPGPIELRIPGTTQFGPYRVETRVLDAAQVESAAISGGKSPFLEYLDFDRIRPPVVVRTRRNGDRFVPLGQQRQKKLGKFLTTAKVPTDLRSTALIIEDAERILWVCPVRISERAKVTDQTPIILELRISEM
jgi:tRNA(Ile)-lysidine synthase